MDSTLKYYNQNADQFVQGTLSVDFKQTQDRFLAKLPADAYILEISKKLGISDKTVRNHISNVILRLDVNGRTQAIVKLIQMKELEI